MSKELISLCLEKNILIEKNAMAILSEHSAQASDLLSKMSLEGITVLTEEHLKKALFAPVEIRKGKKRSAKDFDSKVGFTKEIRTIPKEKTIDDFISYYSYRYDKLKEMLQGRQELKHLISLGRLNQGSAERNISVIGIIKEIRTTKNNNKLVELEDPTGTLKVLIKEGKDIGENQLLTDEVIGVSGSVSRGFFFANSITFPDIPFPAKINKINDPLNAVFISDLHFGSNEFLPKISERFLKWINSDEKEALRVKYLFIAGDVVDGVGIYPSQEKDLTLTNIYDQYAAFEGFVEKIPEHIEIMICPGNHDAVRQAEPQPAFTKELLPNIYNFRNVHLVTNPAFLNVHALDCSGISVLMYHGYSFTRIIDSIQPLREKGLTHPQHVMKMLLRKRHLAPLCGSTNISPEEKDNLVIDKIPDIFHTGDLHSFCVDNYRGTTLISSSTFQGQTEFMDRVGHTAIPGKVTIVQLDTRNVIVKDFLAV